MGMIFEVSKSFYVPCDSNKYIRDDENIDKFWEEAYYFKEKQGCYVFAVRAARGYTPWYVGKTNKSFKEECFTDNKLVKYNNVLHPKNEKLHGKPVIFFIAPPGGKKKVRKKIVNELETFLIRTAKFTNPKLMNKMNVKLPDWGIKGVIRGGSGSPTSEARSFSKMMDL
jgi:hypothetical protein